MLNALKECLIFSKKKLERRNSLRLILWWQMSVSLKKINLWKERSIFFVKSWTKTHSWNVRPWRTPNSGSSYYGKSPVKCFRRVFFFFWLSSMLWACLPFQISEVLWPWGARGIAVWNDRTSRPGLKMPSPNGLSAHNLKLFFHISCSFLMFLKQKMSSFQIM